MNSDAAFAVLAMCEAWGVPPWMLERECSARWALAFAAYERHKAREVERATRRARLKYGGIR